MTATPAGTPHSAALRLLAAALALPGVLPGVLPGEAAAQAEIEAPPTLSLRSLHYRDEQPGLARIRVTAPAVSLQLPLSTRWSVYAMANTDSVSGASPRYHSAISGASRMTEERKGGELRLTRHEERMGWTLGLASSDERDWRSRAASATWRLHSEDRNRSWQLGAALTRDRIGSVDDPDLHQSRRTVEFTAGLTQVIDRRTIAQLSWTHAAAKGWFNDPYKSLEQRPGSRHQNTWMLRWNHHLEAGFGAGSTVRLNVRNYRDNWGVRASTASGEWLWPVSRTLQVAPLVRLHTQNAARFYADPVYSFLGAPYPPGWLEAPPTHLSLDQRLSAFGAITLGLKAQWNPNDRWSAELRVERYEQRGNWRLGGPGSPGLAPFGARMLQWGLTRRF